MTVHALVLQRALSILSYSECKITKIFRGFAPGPHSEGFTAPSVSPAAPPKSFCTPKKFLLSHFSFHLYFFSY